ncbi:T-DNA border endonuclease virD2 [Marinovum algicola]|uniref:Type IV secretion system T-DNA border endonuclease VirD2 n=1 Tax=Marinovum algicola TaxID=42444 RepID=A0A975WBS0_9RHOB|nr:relaxase/mobilization nuclease domain-containing protein [Marinovum algicola]SEJ81722.1 type IV secretion system T-DNA border endonuclease VirD2 [Marinovum algicola]SLN63475.1 T-DNA border endonuclease virD2 [Marinovum algicola]
MRLNDAVHDVTGEIFRDGWSRIRGSMQGLHVSKQKQLVRAAAGHRAAVFKAIRSGGTHTKSQLTNQLDYLTTKSSFIVDSSGFLDGKEKLEAGEIKDLTERFAKRWDGGFKPKLGQTTHLLMSFPIGTRGEDVRDIASDVAERFLQTDEGHFDYIIAVHEDRDHPHAHLVLNRRSQEGEFFYLGRNHRFNYDDFRLAMVEEAEKYGVRLEATRRIDRGEVHYPPRTREVYAAKAEGRMAAPRARVGADRDLALQEIANTRTVYHSLAAEASKEAREDIADALFRAGELLAKGGKLTSEGGVYMAEDQTFDDLRTRYAEQVERIQGMIAEKPEAERPRLEKSLNEIQSRLAHMQPLGLRSGTLTERPSEGGVYSEQNIDASQLDRLRDPEIRAQVDTALRGTGISSSVVVARMETGAQNAALERQWIADDLSRVAERDGLNLERRDDLETARETLNRAHVQLGTALERAGVLRRDGVTEVETVTERIHYDSDSVRAMEGSIRQEMRAEGLTERQIDTRDSEVISRAERRIEVEQRDWLAGHPEILERPGDVIDRSEPYREHITDDARAGEIAREVDRIMDGRDVRTSVAEAVSESFRDRYPDMPAHLTRGLGATYAAVVETRDTDAINEVRRAAERDSGSTVTEITRGVADQFDRAPSEFTRFERVVIERDLLENDRAQDGNGVDLSSAVQDLNDDLKAGRLDPVAAQRAEVLIRETVARHGDRMSRDVDRDYLERMSAREAAFLSGSDGDKTVTEMDYERIRSERDGLNTLMREYAPSGDRERVEPDEIRRVIKHERAGDWSSPFETVDQRVSYRDAIERDLDEAQIDRLRDGDIDVLKDQIEDRLDRLYAAKHYLQSDAATANSAATRAVVEEIADREYERERADLTDGETERGETH